MDYLVASLLVLCINRFVDSVKLCAHYLIPQISVNF